VDQELNKKIESIDLTLYEISVILDMLCDDMKEHVRRSLIQEEKLSILQEKVLPLAQDKVFKDRIWAVCGKILSLAGTILAIIHYL